MYTIYAVVDTYTVLICTMYILPWVETWRRIWGDQQKIFAAQFQEKCPFSGYKFLMTFFLVIDLVLRIFPFFSHIFRMFTMLNVVYDHFLIRKTQFFTLFMLSRTSDNTTSKNIGGANGPPPKIGGDRPPVPPRSPPLRTRTFVIKKLTYVWSPSAYRV